MNVCIITVIKSRWEIQDKLLHANTCTKTDSCPGVTVCLSLLKLPCPDSLKITTAVFDAALFFLIRHSTTSCDEEWKQRQEVVGTLKTKTISDTSSNVLLSLSSPPVLWTFCIPSLCSKNLIYFFSPRTLSQYGNVGCKNCQVFIYYNVLTG